MTDLHRILSDLQDAASTGAGPAPLEQVLRLRRRRRTVQRAGLSAASVAAVTAVLVTGSVLMDREAPTPPAVSPTPSPSPSEPTPEPTEPVAPEPVVLPTGDASLPFGECGSLVATPPPTPAAGTGWTVSLGTADDQLVGGEPLMLNTGFTYGSTADDEVLLSPETGPDIAVALDGVVVATGTLMADRSDALLLDMSILPNERSVQGGTELGVCAPASGGADVTVGRALPPGQYTVHALLPVTAVRVGDLDLRPYWEGERPTAELLELPGAVSGVAHSAPLVVTVTGEADQPQLLPEGVPVTRIPEPDPSRDDVSCGDPAPEPWDVDGMFELRTLVPALPPEPEPGVAGSLAVTAELVYTGGGRVRLAISPGIEYTVVQDGVVAAVAQNAGSGAPEAIMRHGARQQWAPIGQVVPCGDPSGSLTPGTYTVYPSVPIAPRVVTAPSGETVAAAGSGGWITVRGEPFEVVVE